MQKILRNVPPQQKIVPSTLENTRPPEDYKEAVVANYNNRYKRLFSIDPAKAKLVSVRQNSFKPWLATVVLSEEIYDEDGKLLTTNQRSTQIERMAYNKGQLVVTRAKNETPFDTWKKVEVAGDFEENELDALLLLKPDATEAIYTIAKNSLNWYGQVRVKFKYVD